VVWVGILLEISSRPVEVLISGKWARRNRWAAILPCDSVTPLPGDTARIPLNPSRHRGPGKPLKLLPKRDRGNCSVHCLPADSPPRSQAYTSKLIRTVHQLLKLREKDWLISSVVTFCFPVYANPSVLLEISACLCQLYQPVVSSNRDMSQWTITVTVQIELHHSGLSPLLRGCKVRKSKTFHGGEIVNG
jgi:hypothetical protein